MTQIINLKDIEYLDTINKKFVFDNEQSSLTLLSFKSGVERSKTSFRRNDSHAGAYTTRLKSN